MKAINKKWERNEDERKSERRSVREIKNLTRLHSCVATGCKMSVNNKFAAISVLRFGCCFDLPPCRPLVIFVCTSSCGSPDRKR